MEGAEGVDLAQPGPHVLQDMEESQLYIYSHHLSFNKLLHLEIGHSMHQAGESFFVENYPREVLEFLNAIVAKCRSVKIDKL